MWEVIWSGLLGLVIALIYSFTFSTVACIIGTSFPIIRALSKYEDISFYIRMKELKTYWRVMFIVYLLVTIVLVFVVFLTGTLSMKICFSIYALFSTVNGIRSSSSPINKQEFIDSTKSSYAVAGHEDDIEALVESAIITALHDSLFK